MFPCGAGMKKQSGSSCSNSRNTCAPNMLVNGPSFHAVIVKRLDPTTLNTPWRSDSAGLEHSGQNITNSALCPVLRWKHHATELVRRILMCPQNLSQLVFQCPSLILRQLQKQVAHTCGIEAKKLCVHPPQISSVRVI